MTQPSFFDQPAPASAPSDPRRCPCGGVLVLLYVCHHRCSRCGQGLVERST